MAWKTINRNEPPAKPEEPVLSEALKDKIRAFFPRYETKRAALLPALHVIQDELGCVSWVAQQEVAELLELPASDVFDVVTFYTYFWTKPRGKKVVTVCRSISCEAMGANDVLAECKKVLGIGEHETTPKTASFQPGDRRVPGGVRPRAVSCTSTSGVTRACPKPEQVRAILADPNNDVLEISRGATLFDGTA